ncbi:MAG: radical SAM family heme chaperone HemW [Clostridia bacterium]|nr:radical SAM family heme chaperone HemW [Clostridia bacterium]
MMSKLGIYIHVPFCKSKCPYCDFYSICNLSDENKDNYTNAVEKELVYFSKRLKKTVDSIYFGGGTPTLLGDKRLSSIIKTIVRNFDVENSCEITVEANPDLPIDLDFLKLKAAGVNRVSLGVQSANENELVLLGRKHSKNDVLNAVKRIKKSGIDNISFDLMICIQNQNINSLKKSLDFALQADIKHISAYMLKIEPKTMYYKNIDSLNLPSEDSQSDMYLYMCDYLTKRGFNQYEISNFSTAGYESRHNLKYWNSEEYLGIGPNAHSNIAGIRFYCKKSFSDFIKKPSYLNEKDNSEITINNIDFENATCSDEQIEEYIMLRLRLREGLIFKDFYKRFGFEFPAEYIKNIEILKNTDLIEKTKESISLTSKGFLVSNIIINKVLYG